MANHYNPGLVILSAGAAKTRGPFHLTMNTNDAIETTHAFAKATIVAVHNDGWAHFTETQEDLARAFEAVGLSKRLQTLVSGVNVSFSLGS